MDRPTTSRASMGMMTREADKIYLIGHMSHQITGNKLPSNCQVLRVLFYNMRQVKLMKREAASLTIREVLLFWEKAKIPTRAIQHCVAKLEKLYDVWKKLQKSVSRSTNASQIEKEGDFKSSFDDLFDIAHQDALAKISEEDKQFLLNQRKKGRPGCMGGVDMKNVSAEKRKAARQEAAMTRLKKSITNTGKVMP